MGINNTSNTGNSGFITVGKQVTPGIPVTIPAYTTTGWTAGDYLYNSANGVVGAPSGTVAIGGPITTLQATSVTVTGGLFNATQTLINPNKTGATYTGASTTPGSQIFLTEQSSTTSTTPGRCVSLVGGSIVETFYDTGAATQGYYYIIYDVSGTVVTAKTLIQAVSTGQPNIIPVALSDGTFIVGYYDTGASNFVTKKYSATGVLQSTTTRTTSWYPGGNYCMRGIQLSTGNVVIAYSTYNGYCSYVITSSSNAAVTQGNFNTTYFYEPSYPNMGFGLYELPTSVGYTGAWGCVRYTSNYGQSYYTSYTSSGSNFSTAATNTTGYYSMDLVKLQDGSYLWVYSSSGSSLLGAKVTFTTSTGNISVSGGQYTLSSNFSYTFNVKLVPYLGSGFYVAYFYQGSSYNVYYVSSTGTTSSLSLVTSEQPLTYSQQSYGFELTCGINGAIYYSISLYGGTTYLGAQASQTVTNGTTYTATALTPPNYAFLGIAENTTAAGTVGNVIVGGNAVANSSTPSISGTFAFDAVNPVMFGNKGFVTGRNFTLKGFE